MKDFDHWSIDGHGLRLFLAVLEEGSVTGAASRLDLTQSAVSHGLTRLRAITGDPLFVKAGRGIVPTAHALALAARAHALVDGMRDFARSPRFEPSSARLTLTIAANDLQRDILLPPLLSRLEASLASVSIRVVPSDRPGAELLRENRCDLIVTPRPPEGTDILQRALFEDHYVCFYDPACRAAPRSRAEYEAARHVSVVHASNDPLAFDQFIEALGIRRAFAVVVPHFSGVPAFLRGTQRLATLPSLLAGPAFDGLARAPIPVTGDVLEGAERLPMRLAWHRRSHLDPAQAWVREVLTSVATEVKQAGAGVEPA